jgi:hypothetical protein
MYGAKVKIVRQVVYLPDLVKKKRVYFILNTEVLNFIYDVFVWQIIKK